MDADCWAKHPINLKDIDHQEAKDRQRIDRFVEEVKREQDGEKERNACYGHEAEKYGDYGAM